MQHLLERHDARDAVDERQHDDAEADLQLGVLVELVQHHLRDGVALELDDDVDAVAVGAVVDVADLGKLLVAHELAELLEQAVAVYLVGDLAHDDGALAVFALLHRAFRADGEGAAAGLVRVEDALFAHDDAAGREVGTGQHLHQLVGGDVGVVEHQARRVDRFAQVMRRDVGRHADGDAVGAVDQQVGETRGQNRRLLQALVVVGLEIDRLLVEVAQQLHGRLVEARLGVAHGRGRVAVDGAEVSMAVDQRHAHAERLGEADHGVVHRGVAMRMVLADHVADRAGGLHMGTGGRISALVHRVQDAAMDGFETVAHIRQGARDDDAHRVLEEGGLHLLAQIRGAHDGALAAVGVLDDGAVGVGHVHHHRLRARLVGHRCADGLLGGRLLFGDLLLIVGILFGTAEQLVERSVLIRGGIVVFDIVSHANPFNRVDGLISLSPAK